MLALTDFKDSQNELNNLARICKENFNNQLPTVRKPDQGFKSKMRDTRQAKLATKA